MLPDGVIKKKIDSFVVGGNDYGKSENTHIYIYILRMEVQRHVQCNLYIYMYHMYFGSRIKRLEKVRFPFRRYAAYGPSVIASNFAD